MATLNGDSLDGYCPQVTVCTFGFADPPEIYIDGEETWLKLPISYV